MNYKQFYKNKKEIVESLTNTMEKHLRKLGSKVKKLEWFLSSSTRKKGE